MTESRDIQLMLIEAGDKLVLSEAIMYLKAIHRLLNPKADDDWVGAETIAGLERIRVRMEDAHTYEIPRAS